MANTASWGGIAAAFPRVLNISTPLLVLSIEILAKICGRVQLKQYRANRIGKKRAVLEPNIGRLAECAVFANHRAGCAVERAQFPEAPVSKSKPSFDSLFVAQPIKLKYLAITSTFILTRRL